MYRNLFFILTAVLLLVCKSYGLKRGKLRGRRFNLTDEYEYDNDVDNPNHHNRTLTVAILLNGTEAQLRKISRESLLNALWAIQKIELPIGKKLILWEILKGDQSVTELERETFEKLGNIVLAIPESNLYNLNVTNVDVVDYFGRLKGLSRRQAGIIAYAVKNTYEVDVVKSIDLINRLNGLICGFSPQELGRISIEDFSHIAGTVFQNIGPCTMRQKKVLLRLAMGTKAYGPPEAWKSKDLSKLGLLISAMDKDALPKIKPEAVEGIESGSIEALTKEQLSGFTKFQLEYLSDLSLTAFKQVMGLPSDGQTTRFSSIVLLVLLVFCCVLCKPS